MTEQKVKFEIENGVGRITLNRPEARNALDTDTLVELARLAVRAHDDDKVRAVLLTGAGQGFCAGGDVKQMMAMGTSGDRTPAELAYEGAGNLHQAMTALVRMPKPVVCAINGVAAGAGVSLALMGDVVWASEQASFRMSYTAIGLSPDGGSTSCFRASSAPSSPPSSSSPIAP